MSVRQASLRLGISRNTATKWLSEPEMVEPQYPVRQTAASVLDPFKEQLVTWLKADSHRNKRERRGTKALFEALRAMGYSGSSTPVYRFARRWKLEQSHAPKNVGVVPLHFELGEAFQFDWSCEYAFIGGLERHFGRDQTIYDWQHYIALVERKPGALRNGAPFREMPEPLVELQRQLLKHPGGDRVMAQVLLAVNLHGLEEVLVATELELQAGRVSAEHVLNVIARLKEPAPARLEISTPLQLNTPALANLERYDALRDDQEARHE